MTDYLRLAQERAPQSLEQQDNPYLPLAQQAQALGQNRARTVIETALRDDPDIAAERQRLSRTSGVPLNVVERNLEELRIKERARAVDLVTLAQESPVLYRQIADPTFTTTSIDDLDTLKNIERTIGSATAYAMGAKPDGGLATDAVGLAKDVGLGATVGVGRMMFNLAGTVNDLIGWKSGAEAARAQANRAQESMNFFGSQGQSSTAQAVRSGAQSAGQNLALLPLGLSRQLFATANQAAAAVAGAMSAGVGADAYLTAREKGRTQVQALGYAIPEAAFEYVFERIPASKLFGDIAANTGLLKTIGKQTVSEGWTEQVTTLAQDFNEWMNLNPDKTIGQFIQERPEAAYQTFIATLVGVGVQTSTIKGINKVIEQASNQALSFEQDRLQQQMALASQSLLRQRSPEQFRAHVEQVVEANPDTPQQIYVDAEVLNQLPQEVLAQLPETVRAQIPEALDTNSTVAISMADVLTVAPGTELEQVLNDNARMRPNASSRVEAQLAAEMIQQEADRVLAQAADQTAWQQSTQAVQQTILDQLTATGRFSADVNQAYATLQSAFFSTMAARSGTTPEQFYQDWSLKVANAQQAGQVLNAEAPLVVFDEALLEVAKRDTAALRGMASYDLQEDVQGVLPGKLRALDRSLQKGLYTEDDIAQAFQSTRDALRQRYGERLTLWRADAPEAEQNADTRTVFMADENTARKFAENGREAKAYSVSVDDVLAVNALPNGYYEVIARKSAMSQPVFNQTPGALPIWSLERAKGARITDTVKKAAIALAPTATQARKNYDKLDAIFAKVPDPLASEEAWRKFMSLLVADRDVLGVPYNALKYAQSPEAVAEYLSRLRPDQLASRRAGFELGAKIRQEYLEGRATPVTTGRLLLWAMLSRKAGAYPHEAAYMDLVNGGVDQWIEKAVNGTWTEADSENYVKWSSEFMASKKGGVSPSAGVTSNANDFGRILLTKMSSKDENGETALTRLHNLIADPNVSTDQVRREFFALGDSLGIQNKVLSFALLVTGRWDTLVLDRVQFTHLWGDQYRERAGQRNIYDNGLAAAGEGHFGLAVYEALARGMTESLRRGYELAGLTEQGDGTLGAFHWDSWLIESSQAIGHPTIEALDTETPRPNLAVRQGKFDTYSYNFEYRADGQYQIPLLDGSGYRIMSPAEAAEFAKTIADDKMGVVPKGFKVSQNKTSPWVDAEGVNRGRYDEILNQYGRRADAADVAPAGLADAGGSLQQPATDAGRAEPAADIAAGTNTGQVLEQGPRGTFNPQALLISLNENADLSTFLHESGHFFLEVMADLASRDNAPQQIRDDMAATLKWFGIKGDERVGGPDAGGELAQSVNEITPPDVVQTVFAENGGVGDIDESPDITAKSLAFAAMAKSEGFTVSDPGAKYFRVSKLLGKDADGYDREVSIHVRVSDHSNVNRGIHFGGTEINIAPDDGYARDTFATALWKLRNADVNEDLETTIDGRSVTDFAFYQGGNAPVDNTQPAGRTPLDVWNAMTLDQKRQYHERWAESFEQYLFEGKAPNIELQPLFRRFRSFMVAVYKSLTQFMRGRDLKVSDEIRAVFDRMIATDEQIAQAEEAAGMLPDFEATNEAIETLQARSLRDLKWTINARSKYIKKLTKEAKDLRKAVEAEVRAEVEQKPEVKAKRALDELQVTRPEDRKALKDWNAQRKAALDAARETIKAELLAANPEATGLKKGQLLAKNKRDIENRAEAKALEWEQANPRPVLQKVDNDLDIAVIADAYNFGSVDEMLQAIDSFGKVEDAIEGMTDQRMIERHGDLATPEAIEAAANEAVHNEARARSLATELKSQSEMMNQRQDTGRTASNGRAITVNAITQAAKEFALNLAARRRIKDLKNAAWQHRAAEARAGKRWQQLTAEGKTQEAVQAKRDQLLNNYAAKALQDAQAEVKKTLEFFKRVVTGNDEKIVERGRDPDVVNAMRAILGAYDIAPRLEKSALAYMETVSKNDPATYAALQPSVTAALVNAKPFSELTLEELRGLTEELRAMWALAKRSRQMEVDGDLIDIQDAADELMARMDAIGIPDQVPGEKGAITDREEAGIKLQFAKSILRRVEQWAEGLDGKFGGPFLRLVFQPIKDAADRYRTAKVEYRQKFTDLVKGIAPLLPPGPVAAPEIGYTFGNARDSGMAELLHAILHTGNDSNKRKLLLGRGWASENADGTLDTSRWDAFIQRLITEGKLRKEHYDFAQGVWDLLEQTKPLAQETHRKVFGRYFAEVTANEVVTPFGTYRGGYVPAQTDSRLVKDAKLRELAEAENESMAYAFPASPSGFTKSRVEYNKPLLLDLRTLGQHLDKVLLFSHMQGAVTDVRRLLTRKDVSYALDRIDPGAYEGMLIPWLNRAAKQVVETPVVGDRKLSRFLSGARSRAGMALMFANLSNTVQQITGFSLAAVKVKPALMMKATGQFIADPKAMKTSVAEASPYMKDRMLNEVGAMNDAVEQILIDPSLLEKSQGWTQRHAYFLQAAVDNTMSPIIWTAAYNQAVEEGQEHKDAVRFADGVVRQTQGSLLPEDISRFESGPGYARLFTQFVSYFNMMANTNGTAVKQIVDEMGLKKGAGKLLYVALAGLLVPIWVAEAIAQAFRGGPDDEDKDGWLDDWLMAVFGLGTLRGLVAQVPIAGQAAQLVVNRFNDNPADDKFSLSPAVSLIESAASSPASVYKAIVDDGNKQKAVRDVFAAATLLTGLPFFAVARPVGYLAGVADDRIEPTGPIDFARGLVTGTASPESKVP